jgi:AcrR family transcriptional regulator
MARVPFRSKRGDTQLPEKVRQVVETLPLGQIGVYILRNEQGEALRIGHSTDLRHRVTSYFRSGATGWPSQVDSVEVILTDSSESAQSLEKQLIGEYRPQYNDHHNPDERPMDPIRKQLIEARRDQILDAATKVFAKKGFHRTTTKEIARTAGIAEGTIYNYFNTKSDLLIGIMSRLAEVEALGEELVDALQGDVRDFFVTTFRHRANRIQQSQEMLQAILPQVLVNPELREQYNQQFVRRLSTMLEQYVQAQIEMGHIRPVNVPLAARAVQSMFVGLIVLRLLGDEHLQSEWNDVPEVLATLIFDGLSPKGEAASLPSELEEGEG